jgi:ABC-type uncharacterized transport system substrate-binding protein
MLRYYRFGALSVIGLLAQAASPALAHPHVWVTARARIVYGADGLITAVRHTWTFDPAFSAFQAMGLNPKGLQDLAKSNAEALADSGYYTALEANGIKQEFDAPHDYGMSFKDGQLTFAFQIPLKTPAPTQAVTLEIYDPSLFASFSMAEGRNAVMLANAPDGCVAMATLPTPRQEVPHKRLSGAFTEVLAAGSAMSVQPAKIAVTCPEQVASTGGVLRGKIAVRDVDPDPSYEPRNADLLRLFKLGDVPSEGLWTFLLCTLSFCSLSAVIISALLHRARQERGHE